MDDRAAAAEAEAEAEAGTGDCLANENILSLYAVRSSQFAVCSLQFAVFVAHFFYFSLLLLLLLELCCTKWQRCSTGFYCAGLWSNKVLDFI